MTFPRDQATRRTLVLLLIYLLAFGAVGYRLAIVQIVHAEEYAAVGAQQRLRTVELPATRGRIYDRNGDVLATSVDAATIYADPRAFRPQQRPDGLIVPPAADATEVAETIAPMLGADVDWVRDRLLRDAHFAYLARQVPYALGDEIMGLGLPGIGMLVEPSRVYPSGTLASQLLGFVGIDGEGLAGLESQYETILRGRPGMLALERAPGGLTIAPGDRRITPPSEGDDLVLTIDREIQHVAERTAAAVTEEYNARGAGVVVLDVKTGEILALASTPTYDPNEYSTSDPERRRSRPATDHMEPGSIQKAVTIAAAIEEGIIGPQTAFAIEPGLTVAGKTFTDIQKRDGSLMTVRQIMEESSNIGTILIAQKLGEEKLASYLDAFGYGRPLGIGYPGEAAGSVLPVEQWSRTSLPTISIGYGVAMTLVQAASVYATIANDGVATQPRLVRGTVNDDGRLSASAPPSTHRVISAETATQVSEMLGAVVDGERGTGSRARVLGYTVAGKTGTARKPLDGARGYSSEYISSFVGFAPVEDPRLVVAIMVDEPNPTYYGGVVAAPAFSEVMGFALGHRRVPPSP